MIATIFAWIGAVTSLVGAGISWGNRNRDKERFIRETEPKIIATYNEELSPRIVFKNDDQEDFTEVSIILDRKRTDWTVMSAFEDEGDMVTIEDFPRQTEKEFNIVKEPYVSGKAFFICVCQTTRGQVLKTRIICELNSAPEVKFWALYR